MTTGRKITRQNGASGGGRASDILRGMFLLGRGDSNGIGYFGGTADSFLAALAPGIALRLVMTMLMLMHSANVMNITKILLLYCGLLLPPVVTHFLAVRWKRDARWFRYATAALWCEWLVLFVLLALTMVISVTPSAMATTETIVIVPVIVTEIYDLWLRWFVARVGLGLSNGRSALLVLITIIALVTLYSAAYLLPPHYVPWGDLFSSLKSKTA